MLAIEAGKYHVMQEVYYIQTTALEINPGRSVPAGYILVS